MQNDVTHSFPKYTPGRTRPVGSDNLSSPTTESERTGVYLRKTVRHIRIYCYIGLITKGIWEKCYTVNIQRFGTSINN